MTSSATEKLVTHLIRRIQHQPELAYYFCELTESFQLLTEAYSEITNGDLMQIRKQLIENMEIEEPKCQGCSY